MQSMLDIIGATIIGGMLMITMFTALITIQENNLVLKGEMQVINDLEYISSIIDTYCLDKVGYELPTNIEAFSKAVVDQLWINTKLEDSDNTIYFVKIGTGTEDEDRGYPMYIQITDKPNIGPIYLSAPLKFDYYDTDGNVIDSSTLATATGRAQIRAVEIVLNVFHGEYNSDSMRTRPLTFRKYFPNLAI